MRNLRVEFVTSSVVAFACCLPTNIFVLFLSAVCSTIHTFTIIIGVEQHSSTEHPSHVVHRNQGGREIEMKLSRSGLVVSVLWEVASMLKKVRKDILYISYMY